MPGQPYQPGQQTPRLFIAPFDLEKDPELMEILSDIQLIFDWDVEHLVQACIDHGLMYPNMTLEGIHQRAHFLLIEEITRNRHIKQDYTVLVTMISDALSRLSCFVQPLLPLIRDYGLWGNIKIKYGDIYMEHCNAQYNTGTRVHTPQEFDLLYSTIAHSAD